MTIVVHLENDFDPVRIKGDLHKFTDELNHAARNGLQYAVMTQENEKPVMVQTIHILKAYEDDDAYIG